MKHPDGQLEQERSLLRRAAESFGLPTPRDDQIATLLAHLDLVLAHNRVTNLTAIRDRERALRLHVVDSLGALMALERAPEGRVCDLGSGPGYPGLPIAVVSGRSTTLVESNGKKCRFLEAAAAELGLSGRVAVSHSRIEEFGSAERGKFALVVARALSSLPSLVELAAPCLAENGWFVALKGSPEPSELRAGDEAARICGLERRSVSEYMLPGGTEHRTLITYVRTAPPSLQLPRGMGKAQKAPLA